nr:hypothetical protein [Staphylococcus aureus]
MSEQQTMSELKQQALVDINEANDERALQEVKVKSYLFMVKLKV